MNETLFIVFAPGLGGNHLANLIALGDRFKREVDYNKYHQKANDAHFAKMANLQLLYAGSNISNQDLENILNTTNIFCGHIGEYLWFMQSSYYQKFKNKKILIVDVPDIGTFAYKRFISYNKLNDYFYHEQKTLYTRLNLSILFKETNLFNINSTLIFDENSTELIRFLEQEFNMNIDKPMASDIHKNWINNIKHSLNVL